MRHDPDQGARWAHSTPIKGPLPTCDCETLALLRGFLTPILETADSWDSLARGLRGKGFDLTFRAGHLVILRAETGEALCTGRALGVPLRSLSARIGKPCIRAHSGGGAGDLALR